MDKYSNPKKKLMLLGFIICFILFFYLFKDELGLLLIIDEVMPFISVLIAGTIGVVMVVLPIFIWLISVLGISFIGIYLILWSFKIYKPKMQTIEQLNRMEICHKKYGLLAKFCGIIIVGCVLYYFIF